MDRVLLGAVRLLPAICVAAMVVLGGCASQPPAPAPVAPVPAPPSEPAPAPPAAPPPPAVPELTPAQAKAQAQKLALEAVEHLQVGDEPPARQKLDAALALDRANDLARKMLDQINADAQKELGPTFFRYRVQRDDTLAKLAQQYLGDRFRFYILAKYNDLPNPSRLEAGQEIKIPGKAPPAQAAPSPPPVGTGRIPDSPTGAGAADADIAALLEKGRQLQASGDLEGAYAAFADAVARAPRNRDAVTLRTAARAALIQRCDREAMQAFQRQNLDLAMEKWDCVLALDPGNKNARTKRERAAELKMQLDKKFGTAK